jgi:lysophospholipase L1-like esterase
VFVCWGGKTLAWGSEQLGMMKSLGVLPQCVVVNLGTNDMKNEFASPTELGERLTGFLAGAAVRRLVIVDIWADVAIAPASMGEVSEAPEVFRKAVSGRPGTTLVPWSAEAMADSALGGWDGVHDSAQGEAVRARAIADGVAAACG